MWYKRTILGALFLAGLLLAGCKGTQAPVERQARNDLATVQSNYWPTNSPRLDPGAGLSNYLDFAILNRPQVRAAYFDWAASVEQITVDRSLPDPKLTFQAYITDVLTSLMPGLMQEFPGPGKLKAAANAAGAKSRAKYFAFETAVLETAFAVKQIYYQLWFLDEKVRLSRETLGLLSDLEKNARNLNEVGKATLLDVYRAQMAQDRLATEVNNLDDSRHALLVQFRAALGLPREAPDPVMPAQFEPASLTLTEDVVFDTAFARNPGLKAMAADVRVAEAAIAVAQMSKRPDFSAGLQAEVYKPPFYWPQASMTLPIWRDKIAAQVAAARAGAGAAHARLDAAKIQLTVDFTMKTHEYRELSRSLVLLREKLLPKARQSLDAARAGYRSGQVDFLGVIDAARTLLDLQLEEVEVKTQREIVLADLSLTIVGVAPEGAPLLRE